MSTALVSEKASSSASDVLGSIWSVIQEQGLRVGDQLPSIRQLAERIDVKPTVVRDALLKAESMGYIKLLPRAGAFLKASVPAGLQNPAAGKTLLANAVQSALGAEDLNPLQLLDARRLIEIELAGRAAERRRLEDLLPVRRALEALMALPADAPRSDYVAGDIRFHVEIARVSGNEVLLALQRTLLELLRPHLNDVHPSLQRRATTDRSHVAIYEALVAGNAEEARTRMRDHLSLAYDGMLRTLQEPPIVNGRGHDKE